jgi:two-component system, NtrC family, response regulator GlrR
VTPDTLTFAEARSARLASAGSGAVELVGRSHAISRVQELLRRAAGSDACTLITGEPGSAVESVARELHGRSRRSDTPFVIVDCGAADTGGVDRLLFGSAPDLSTGSSPRNEAADLEPVTRDSCVAAAIGGTLFLQDVGELPASTQARLARIARDGEVRIDGTAVATMCRLIASASPGLDADVHARRFRGDLYRRLSATRIDLPPLRDRAEDVPLLAQRLLDDCAAAGSPARSFTQTALALLGALTWPGNFAELRDAIHRVVAETDVAVIQVEHVLPALRLLRAPAPFVPSGNLREARLRFEREYIAAVLQHHGWRMAEAAQTLGIQRPNLYRKARQLGIPLARLSE